MSAPLPGIPDYEHFALAFNALLDEPPDSAEDLVTQMRRLLDSYDPFPGTQSEMAVFLARLWMTLIHLDSRYVGEQLRVAQLRPDEYMGDTPGPAWVVLEP